MARRRLCKLWEACSRRYNRDEDDPVLDDFGQIGEIKPMKPKPFVLTSGIAASCVGGGWWKTRQARRRSPNPDP